MSRFVKPDDYVGLLSLSLDLISKKKIQSVIDQIEDDVLICLFGAELYKLFIADLDVDNIPQTQRFIDVFDPFLFDDDCYIIRSSGIKDMLVKMLFIDIKNSIQKQASPVGTVASTVENAELKTSDEPATIQVYNEGVKTYNDIQYYMCVTKPNDYIEFNGKRKDLNSWL